MKSICVAARYSCSWARNYIGCAIRIAQPSAMDQAKKRRSDSGSGSGGVHSTAAGTSTGGGSQHSTATTWLLFADAGCFDEELIDHLIAGTPLEPDDIVMDEIQEVVNKFGPDIYVRPALVKSQNTNWQLIATDDWSEDSRKFIPLQKLNASLYTAYDGCLTTLRRLTPCKYIPREGSQMQTS